MGSPPVSKMFTLENTLLAGTYRGLWQSKQVANSSGLYLHAGVAAEQPKEVQEFAGAYPILHC